MYSILRFRDTRKHGSRGLSYSVRSTRVRLEQIRHSTRAHTHTYTHTERERERERETTLTSTVTGPVARFARQIAGQGYICAAPSSYHEFTGPEPLEYNAEDTEHGNKWKVTKKLGAYDEDAKLAVNYLLGLDTCNGRVGATGMCLGGHLAYRCALDRRVKAAVCYFATDIHSRSLGAGKQDDSLLRAGDIKGELLMVYTPLVRCFCPEN